jgi:hypothetical protein
MESEMDAELRFHIEAFAEDLVRSGVPREKALRRARIEFGGLERAKEDCRDARGFNFIESLIQDLRYGLRMLRKNPGFASTVILTLGLGIGLNSAIFTVASGFLLREPPVKDPPNVVMLTMVNPAESWDRNPVTPTEFSALRGHVHSFEGMAAVLIENLPLIGRGDPESVTVARVTSNYFALLGVPAHLGRTFVPGEGSHCLGFQPKHTNTASAIGRPLNGSSISIRSHVTSAAASRTIRIARKIPPTSFASWARL